MNAVLVILAGILQAAMASFNGVLAGHAGLFGVSIIVHFTGGMLLLFYILLFVRRKIVLGRMPWYLYSAGFFGVLLVSLSSFCIQYLGASVTTCLSVTGQLLISIVIDHFGLFGVPQMKFNPKRIPCILLIVAGIFVINLG